MRHIESILKYKEEINMKIWVILLIFFTSLLWKVDLSAQQNSKSSRKG